MKRIVSLMLCMALLLANVSAFASQGYSTQPEKLSLQFGDGSGIKGTITAEISGDAAWAQMLSPLSGIPFEVRAEDGKLDGYHYRMYISDAGEQLAMSEIYSPDGMMGYIRSDFLTDTLVSFASKGELLSSLGDLNSENPTWYTIAMKLMNLTGDVWRESWEPQFDEARLMLDKWLASYASTPEMIENQGEKRVLLQFNVPADAVKQGMKQLMNMLMSNEQLMTQLRRRASSEQQLLYMHAGYAWYYEQVIDQLPLSGSIVIERQMSTLGEERSMLCILPVADTRLGLREVTLAKDGDVQEVSLSFSDKVLSWSMKETAEGETEGYVHLDLDGMPKLHVNYQVRHEKSATDDDSGRNHEMYDWTATFTPDLSGASAQELVDGQYVNFDEAKVHVNVHLYSKPGDTTPVTIKLQAAAELPGGDVKLTADLKSASPWYVPAAPGGATISLESMNGEQRMELLSDWFNNGLLALTVLNAATNVETAPADDALTTATDLKAE